MRPYLDLLRHVLIRGERRTDRTGTGTLSVFGTQTRYDLRDGFPLVTTKRVPFSAVVRELLWFLRGSTNINDGLTEHTRIWDAWADVNGDLGPIYGHQWTDWGGGPHQEGINQVADVLRSIQANPDSRRHIVSAWNVADLPQMALPPCHVLFQFYVQEGHLDCQLYQRSADMMLGVPFNIASYALLLSMFGLECGLVPRYFIHTIGDAHVYLNHLDGAAEQLTRDPFPLPRLVLADRPLFEQRFEDISLEGYVSHPAIRLSVAV